jgi:pimeloyl-ACP methyl ester carboxylesterase
MPESLPTFPGAREPDRVRRVDSAGVGLSVKEWGDPDAPPVLMAHGGFDVARTLDVFAPMLVDGGWRVVSWDQRGHGDSDHAALYSWEADVRDATAVLATVADQGRPIPLLGHSKGGGLAVHLADALPHRVRAVVNLDGLPSRGNMPDVSERERTRFMARELDGWLQHRLGVAGKARRPGTIDELAERRARMNPRLSLDWLRHLVSVGAFESDDGWRWKIDASMRMGGFGPWRPEWSMSRLPSLGMPVLCVLGLDIEVMGWGTVPKEVFPWLPVGGECEILEDAGHFVHIEQPDVVAGMVLDFVGSPA